MCTFVYIWLKKVRKNKLIANEARQLERKRTDMADADPAQPAEGVTDTSDVTAAAEAAVDDLLGGPGASVDDLMGDDVKVDR